MITEKLLQERKARLMAEKQQLEATIRQVQANLNATEGAIQDCDHWLSMIAQPEDDAA